MKTNRHSLMAKGIMVLLSLLILVFMLTYSWFSPGDEVTASGLTAVAEDPGADFDYAIGFKTTQTGGEYLVTDFTNAEAASLDIEHLHVAGKYQTDDNGSVIYSNGVPVPFDYNLMYDYSAIDITGDGATLVRPDMDYGNWSINEAADDYSAAEANVQYISFDLIFRSKGQITVYLGPKSHAAGASETKTVDGETVDAPDGSKLTGLSASSVERPSDYGLAESGYTSHYFSSDAIVGAVRVAFLGFNTEGLDVSELTNSDLLSRLNSKPALLWVPRPDVYLNNTNPAYGNAVGNREKETTGWLLNTGVQDSARFNLKSEALEDSSYTTYQHQQYNIFNESLYISKGNLDAATVKEDALAAGAVGFASNDNYYIIYTTSSDSSAVRSALASTYTFADNVSSVGDRAVITNESDYVRISSKDEESNEYHLNDTVQLTTLGENSLTEQIDGETYYYNKVRVRIWIEGTDTEARRALAKGKFKVNFDFTSTTNSGQ